jgi:hypothetical protein
MNELTSLSSFGLQIPGPAYIVGSILFGLVACHDRQGKKKTRTRRA